MMQRVRATSWLWLPMLLCQPVAADSPSYRDVTLTLTEGTWMSLDVSPDGQTIAFDLLNDIYVMPASGGEARAIHRGPATQRSPQFSPDGSRLLYLSDESGADNLWTSAVDGSDRRQITHETIAMVAGPAWSADGRSAFAVRTGASVLEARKSEICSYPLDGGPGTRLVEAPTSGKDLQEPRASLDGRYLYYTERRGGTHFVYVNSGLANFVIRRRDLRTGESVDLISGFGSATTPQVSPDGHHVAFIRRVGAKTVLFRYDVATRTQHPIYAELDRDLQADYIPQEHYYPAFDWFPDNRTVAIWAKGQLLKIDMQSGAAQPLLFRVSATHRINQSPRVTLDAAPARVEVKIVRQLAIAPRRDEILFRALGKIWRQDMAGKRPPSRLTQSKHAQSDPAWSPDGRWIAYAEWNDEQGSTLILQPAPDGGSRAIARSRGVIGQPVFSRDGRTLAYVVLAAEAAMGGAADKPGLYAIGLDDAQPRFLTAATRIAQFSPDDERIYFFGEPDLYGGKAVRLMSIAVAGGEIREHAHAVTADTGDVVLSPDFKWVAFKEFHQLYVMPYREGGEPAIITARGNASARRLTETGAFEPVWTADSSQLMWVLGNQLFATRPADQGVVSRSLRSVRLSVPADVPDGTVAFVNARILPMSGVDVIERGTVVVRRNRIVAVDTTQSVTVPAEAHVIDLEGKTLMPGFFDAHGHIDCCRGGATPIKHPTRYAALAYGVTANFDPYSTELTNYESAEMTLAGAMVGPRWLGAGRAVFGRSGLPDRAFEKIGSIEDARNIARRKRNLGATILKSYKLPTRAQKQQLLQAARENALMVDLEGAGHFYDNIGAILDGYTNLEHNLPVATYYDDLLQLFKAADMSHTPTLIVAFGELFGENFIYEHQQPWKEAKVRAFIPSVTNAYNPIPGDGYAPPHVRAMQSIHQADELYDIGFRSVGRSVKRLDDAGVTINVGSHGQAAGLAMHWEMQLLAEGGMSPMRILRAATINGAKTWGLERQLGSIEPGKLADLIVLDKDPLADIRNSDSVRYTMINGRLYDSSTMNEIGNYDRPRSKFWWESTERHGIDWNPAWGSGTP